MRGHVSTRSMHVKVLDARLFSASEPYLCLRVVYHACTIFRAESNLMVCDSSNHKMPFLS